MHPIPTPHSGISPMLAFYRCTMTLFFFMLVLQTNMVAQITDQPMISKVYLENKSVFYGEILSWDENGVMLLQSTKGITFSIPSNTIKKVVQKPIDFIRPRGWYGGGAIGMGFNEEEGMLMADIYGGFARHRMLHIGLMTGIHLYADNYEEQFVTLQLEWRGYWSPKPFSPYTVARVGTSFGFYRKDQNQWFWEERTYRPGLNMELLFGFRLGHLGPSHFALEAGYLRQDVSYNSILSGNWGPGDKHEVKRIHQRWVFRLVIGF